MMNEAIADLELPVSRQSATTLQTEATELLSTPILAGPEIPTSTSRPPRFLATAAIAICAALARFFTWHSQIISLFHSAPPAIVASRPESAGASAMAAKENAASNLGSTGTSTPTRGSAALATATHRVEITQSAKVRIAAGDTLEGLATTHMGSFDGSVLRQIQALNPNITDPNHIETGSTIRLPERGGSGTTTASARLQP
jgi:phage tail protein X